MGYTSKDIAVISEPKIVTLSALPNFVQFASKPANKTILELNIQVNAVQTTPVNRTVLNITSSAGELHSFRGTTNPVEVGGNVFYISADTSDTAENLRQALLSDQWIKANFEIVTPFLWSGDLPINGSALNIKAKGAGVDFQIEVTAPNNIGNSAYLITWVNSTTVNNDSISGEYNTAEIELDLYTDPAVLLGEDDRPITTAKIGKYLTTLSKTYAGAPLWFELNALFSQYPVFKVPPIGAFGRFNIPWELPNTRVTDNGGLVEATAYNSSRIDLPPNANALKSKNLTYIAFFNSVGTLLKYANHNDFSQFNTEVVDEVPKNATYIIASNFKQHLNPYAELDRWLDTGTASVFRFVAKVKGVNTFAFYQSNALYVLNGYGKVSDEINIDDYVYDGKTIKLLTNKPVTKYIRGQREYLNFVHEVTPDEYELKIIYRAYSTAGDYLGRIEDAPKKSDSFNIVNTCAIDIDKVLDAYPLSGKIKVSLYRGEVEVSNSLEYEILPECLHVLNQFTFLNMLGGWDSFNTDAKILDEIKIESSTYNKTLTPDYNKGDSLETVYTTKLNNTITIESAPFTDDVAEWLKEFAAARVILNNEGDYVILEDFELKRDPNNKNMHTAKIKYRLSENYTND